MSIYTGLSVATLSAQLTAAQEAHHALRIGKQVVSLSIGDKRLAFTPADVDQLARYIRELQTAIAVAQGNSDPRSRPAVATWTR